VSNPTNIFDFATEDLPTFLAKAVSDGTYSDVFETLKGDAAGEEADATAIPVASGQIWGNGTDDFVLAAYPLLRQVALGFPAPTVANFNDNTTFDLPVADVATQTSITGSLSLWNATTGEAATYRVTISMDATGHALDINIIQSPTPISTVVVSTFQVGTVVNLRFTGSGPGDNVKVTWQPSQVFIK